MSNFILNLDKPHYKDNQLAKEEVIEMNGVVSEVLPQTRFRVLLENGINVMAYLSGKMRMHHVRIIEGDKVTLEISPYDVTKARINYRHKEVRANAPAGNKRPPYRK